MTKYCIINKETNKVFVISNSPFPNPEEKFGLEYYQTEIEINKEEMAKVHQGFEMEVLKDGKFNLIKNVITKRSPA
jgi:histidinol phosphatase-like PHP family hydrolase